MSYIQKYRIVSAGGADEMERIVNGKIGEGWEPQGTTQSHYSWRWGWTFIQVMVIRELRGFEMTEGVISKTKMETDLIGKKFKPAFERVLFNRKEDLWQLEPDATGHFYAKIVAVWLDHTGNLKVVSVGPRGDVQEGYLLKYILMLDDKDPGAELPI